MNKSKQGRSNRSRGHAFEVYMTNVLKQYGHEATTARYSCRELDDLGVDIVTDAPFNIQCKYVDKLSPGVHDILKAMPNIRGKTNILAHKRANKGTIISMRLEDFADLLLYQPHEH